MNHAETTLKYQEISALLISLNITLGFSVIFSVIIFPSEITLGITYFMLIIGTLVFAIMWLYHKKNLGVILTYLTGPNHFEQAIT